MKNARTSDHPQQPEQVAGGEARPVGEPGVAGQGTFVAG